MSIAEMKEETIRRFVLRISEMEDEDSIKQLLAFLEPNENKDKKDLNLSRHYNSIKQQYGSVLEKLAK